MSHLSDPFYHPIELNDTHHDNCFLKVRLFESNESRCPFIEYRNVTTTDLCLEPVLNGSTGWVFSPAESVFAGVTATLQATLGAVLNLLVIAVFLRTRSFRKEYLTPFILSLAATDLIYSSITLPIIAVRDFAGGFALEEHLCTIFPLFYYGLHMCTMWNLVAISAVRCLGVYFPRKFRDAKFRNKSKLLIVMAWFLSFCPFIPTMTGLFNQHGYTCYQRKCDIVNLLDEDTMKPQKMATMMIGALTVITTLLLLIVLNILIYKKLYYHSQQVLTELKSMMTEKEMRKEVRKEKQFAKTMATITCLFFLTYFPIFLLKSKHPDSAMTHSTENVICTMLASCSVVIDPLVYIINHKKYRRAMIQMFHPKQPDDDDIQGRQRKSSWASSVLSSRVSSVSSVFTRRESSAVQMNP